MFIWLGSGRARRNGVDPKGRLLDEAARARLPVPRGAIILDAFYRFACQEELVVARDERLEIPNPLLFSNTLYHGARLPRLNHRVIIRSAFSIENSSRKDAKNTKTRHLEVARLYHDLAQAQIVDPNDLTEFALAFGRVWSAAPLDGTWRRDTLVMEMIQSDTSISGTAVTSENAETDWGCYNTEEPDHAVLQLPKLSGWQRPDNVFPPFARRLQQLLRGIRRTFGRGNWTIKWVDDGEICWLVTAFPAEES
jgi:hypothetical protein